MLYTVLRRGGVGAKPPRWTGFLYIPTDRVTRTRLIKIRCVGALDL